METENETLEKIADMGVPKGQEHSEEKRTFKFRVSYKVTVRGTGRAHESGFSYYDLASARRCYRDILLALYRGKKVESFAICLNHHSSKPWKKSIHKEAVSENG